MALALKLPRSHWLVRYRVLPRRPWRPALIVLLGAVLFAEVRYGLVSGFHWSRRLLDEADVVPPEVRRFAEGALVAIATESGVDIRFEFVSRVPDATIEQYAARRARELGVGRDTGRRGLLFVYDVASRALRAEVGPALEEHLTDAFMGHLIRTNTGAYFGAGSTRDGLVSTLMMVQHRLRQATLHRAYDPTYVEYIQDVRRLALGGGATTLAAGPGDTTAFVAGAVGAADRAYFSPQPTVEGTYRRYLEWLALGRNQSDAPMFTVESGEWVRDQPMTPGYLEFMLAVEYGFRYRIEERGPVAILYFTDDPFAQPHFFRRTRQGWQMDLIAEILNTMNLAGEPYSWSLRLTGDEYGRAFGDLYRPLGDFWRFADGDNRPLPVHGRFRAWLGDLEYADAWAADQAPVERITVREAVARVRAAEGRPLVLILYTSRGPQDQALFPELARRARAWQTRGIEVLALSTDRDASVPNLPAFLRQHDAPFPAVNLYGWPSGTLDRAMATLDVQVGTSWWHPLVAVRSAEGRVLYQAQGVTDLAEADAAVWQTTRPVSRRITGAGP